MVVLEESRGDTPGLHDETPKGENASSHGSGGAGRRRFRRSFMSQAAVAQIIQIVEAQQAISKVVSMITPSQMYIS